MTRKFFTVYELFGAIILLTIVMVTFGLALSTIHKAEKHFTIEAHAAYVMDAALERAAVVGNLTPKIIENILIDEIEKADLKSRVILRPQIIRDPKGCRIRLLSDKPYAYSEIYIQYEN